MSESGRVSDKIAELERAMRGIWSDTSEQAKVRAHTLNLVAVSGKRALPSFIPLLDEVSANLSARTVLITVDPTLPPWQMNGNVEAVCRLDPSGSRPTVCADRVELELGVVVTKRAGSIVEALTDARVPSVLYVGPNAHDHVVDALAPSVDRLIFDSVELGVDRAADICSMSAGRIEDLAFLRMHRWCDLVARFFDDPDRRPAAQAIRAIELTHTSGDLPGSSAQTDLLVSWLGSKLGWTHRDEKLLDGSGLAVEVTVRTSERQDVRPGTLDSVRVDAEAAGSRVRGVIQREANPLRAAWTLEVDGAPHATRQFAFPKRPDADMACRAAVAQDASSLAREALEFVKSKTRAA